MGAGEVDRHKDGRGFDMSWARSLVVLAIYLAFGALAPAQAHLLGTSGAGFAEGLAHPFSGLDHLLAMVAVGFWATQLGGRAVVLLPVAFPAMMAAGAVGGEAGFPLPAVELGVASSVVALGLLVAFGVRLPLIASVAVIGLFALLHGHSHGTELPMAASPVLYAVGFLGATVTLHAVGIGAGLLLKHTQVPHLARLAGSGTAAAGLLMVAQLI
jgi:urease accessory protein